MSSTARQTQHSHIRNYSLKAQTMVAGSKMLYSEPSAPATYNKLCKSSRWGGQKKARECLKEQWRKPKIKKGSERNKIQDINHRELVVNGTNLDTRTLCIIDLPKAQGLLSDFSLSKYEFYQTCLNYLGYRISSKGVEMDLAKVKVVLEWQRPRTRKHLQSFLGFANFC